MITKDWSSIIAPRVLLVGENSTLQWSDDVIDYVMFLDYYFRPKPYDLGERSRYAEAKNIFDMVRFTTADWCQPQELYATNLSFDILPRPPKGKRMFIPESEAAKGFTHIKEILKANPTIEYVMVMGMQANYYLQKLGLYSSSDIFMHGAQPREMGLINTPPYYQPVDGKVFRKICCQIFKNQELDVKIIPILMAKDYPLRDDNIRIYEALYLNLQANFKKDENQLPVL